MPHRQSFATSWWMTAGRWRARQRSSSASPILTASNDCSSTLPAVSTALMEALTAISVACLTLFDMLKAVDREMEIGGITVTAKSGGRSGGWRR